MVPNFVFVEIRYSKNHVQWSVQNLILSTKPAVEWTNAYTLVICKSTMTTWNKAMTLIPANNKMQGLSSQLDILAVARRNCNLGNSRGKSYQHRMLPSETSHGTNKSLS